MDTLMRITTFFYALNLLSLSIPASTQAGETAGMTGVSYAKNPVFTPLPLGQVKPAGWLRDWCEDAAQGITGHSEELSPFFSEGWLGDTNEVVDAKVMQAKDKQKGYVLEQSGYWIDGAVRLGHLLDDKGLLDKCRLRFDAILKRVEAGKPPMNINVDMWRNGQKWAHWPMAIMGRALVAEYSATGDPRYLRGLEKIYADYSGFNHEGKAFSLITHEGRQVMNIEPMLEAYRLGGNAALREQAVAVLRQMSGEIEKRLAWHEEGIRSGKTNPVFYAVMHGHAVTFNESAKLPAIGYLFTGEPSWLRFSEASFEDMEKNEMLPYGLTSAHEQPGGITPFALTELCNAIDYSWSNIWLLRVTGNALYGDRVERAMFNAGPGGISPDFKKHVYYLCPNRIDPGHPAKPQAGGTALFASKHMPLCCTANVSRLLPDYVMSLWMHSDDGGLAATLYGPSETKTTLGKTSVQLNTLTDYPFGDDVTIKVSPEQPASFPLHLRVPAWCAGTKLLINGQAQEIKPERGFLRVSRQWMPGDVVRLSFQRKPEISQGLCADGTPFASVHYGPLLFALPIPNVPGNLNLPQADVASQFALAPGAAVEVVSRKMPARWSWAAAPVPLELKVAAMPFASKSKFELAKVPVPASKKQERKITLVPFGSTAFRVSMFSVAAAAR